MNDAALWAWFLFDSGVPTQRAKTLLEAWHTQSLSLQTVLDRLPRDAASLGVTSSEAARLSPPRNLVEVQALTWAASLYPAGLHRLPLKLRPALLYYRGDPTVLWRPIISLAPGELHDEHRELLRESINLLLGEELLLAAYEGSDQAALLTEELTYSQGEGLIFANAGVQVRQTNNVESQLIADGRLLILSPLPPTVPHRSSWDDILKQVALAAADRIILSGTAAPQTDTVAGSTMAPALELAPSKPPEADSTTQNTDNIKSTSAASDVLLWVESLFPNTESLEPAGMLTETTDASATYALPAEDVGPAPSTEEILATLSKGGTIPDALRRRLEKDA